MKKWRPLTHLQKKALDYCLANPTHGHVRLAYALDISVDLAQKRIRVLRERGLIPPAKKYNYKPRS